MSYLYDGRNNEELEIPALEIFVSNHYQKYEIPDISIERLNTIVSLNTFSNFK